MKNGYSFPWIDDLLDQMKMEIVFLNIDLKTGYYQLSLKDDDVFKDCF